MLSRMPNFITVEEDDISLNFRECLTQWTAFMLGARCKAWRLRFMPAQGDAPYSSHRVDINITETTELSIRPPMKFAMCTCSLFNPTVFVYSILYVVESFDPDMLIIMDSGVPLATYGAFFWGLGFELETHHDPEAEYGGVFVLWKERSVGIIAGENSPYLIEML
ncbi:hypothetical protein BUALT_Bualt01G0246000 [Buddleja alternifolia]|uniref:Uncharacterized protein n=1 Tax=Buddleja alternifolia TaxID=168488 RepID=A0AAV6YGN6_9LAMI|nr:hypothetical protein BUALT_Bualt01G0246000 [Buddleja alternifolia]